MDSPQERRNSLVRLVIVPTETTERPVSQPFYIRNLDPENNSHDQCNGRRSRMYIASVASVYDSLRMVDNLCGIVFWLCLKKVTFSGSVLLDLNVLPSGVLSFRTPLDLTKLTFMFHF